MRRREFVAPRPSAPTRQLLAPNGCHGMCLVADYNLMVPCLATCIDRSLWAFIEHAIYVYNGLTSTLQLCLGVSPPLLRSWLLAS